MNWYATGGVKGEAENRIFEDALAAWDDEDAMSLKRIKAQPRTAEEIAEEQRVRELFEDRPSVRTLIERGEIDPERIMTGTAEESLLKALSTLSQARQSRGLSLSEIARRSGIDLASLSRLETGKNPNPTFETLSRYADALGLRLELSLIEINVPTPASTNFDRATTNLL